jgi:hypothetical protein
MKNIKILSLCFTLFLFMSFGKDPTEISMTTLLATVKTDAKVLYNQQTLALVNSLNYQLPLLKKAELKVGADNFDLTGQQFGIAISPNTFGQIKQQAAIRNTEINKTKAESTIFIHQALVERYQTLVEMYFSTQLKQKQQALETLLNQKNETLKSMIQRGLDVRIKDIADTENDRYAVQLNILQLETDLASTYEKMKQFMGTTNDILVRFDNVVQVKDMLKTINDLKNNTTLQTPDLVLAKRESEAKKAELNLENASNREILSSIQVVDAPKKGDVFNNFGVRFTLSLPLTGNSRLKRNELTIDLKKAENKESLLQTHNQKAIQYQIVKLENLIKKYRIYADKAENSLIKTLLNNPKVTAEMNALELLDLKLTQQKTEVELAKIGYDITNEYIALLNNTPLLTQMPLKNYLSSSLEAF